MTTLSPPLSLRNFTITELVILIALVSLATFSTDFYVPALPLMLNDLHATTADLQQTLISYMYGFAICMLLSGILADRLGRKSTLLIGISFYTISSLLASYAHYIWQLELLRFCQGLSGCCGTVIARVIVRDRFSSNEAIRILAYLASGMAFSFAFAPIIGSFIVTCFSWRVCFIVMSGLGLLLLLGITLVIDEPRLSNKLPVFSFKVIIICYIEALHNKIFCLHVLTLSLAWTGFFLIIVEYPFLLTTKLHCSTGLLGLTLALIMSGYLVGSIAARKLARINLSPNISIYIGLALMLFGSMVGLSSTYRDPNICFIILPAWLYLIGMGLQMPNSQYAAIAANQQASATITSLLYFLEMLCTAIISNGIKFYFNPGFEVLWLTNFIMITALLTIFTWGISRELDHLHKKK